MENFGKAVDEIMQKRLEWVFLNEYEEKYTRIQVLVTEALLLGLLSIIITGVITIYLAED